MGLNHIDYYHELIDGLSTQGLDILPLSELKPSSKPAIGLRHDIDSRPNVALHMARYLAMKGLPGSFYLLHSASYYTPENIPKIVYKMNVHGCEIGLHNDAWYYGDLGPQMVKKEIEYLRSLGAKVKGTVAHNSLSTYTAANYEVFKEKVLLDRESHLPLGKLSMKKLGLTYEGIFSIPKPNVTSQDFLNHLSKKADIHVEEWMHELLVDNPYCDYETYAQFWLIGKDKWAVAIRGKLHWKIGLTKVLKLAETLSPKTISTFVLHPDYFMADGVSDVVNMTLPTPRRYKNIPTPIRKLGKKILQILRKKPDQRKIVYKDTSPKAQEFDYQWRDIPSPAIELNQDRIIEFLKFTKLPPSFFKNKLCLDAGCGSGRFTWAMQQLGAKVSSFDISPEAIEQCRTINPDAYIQDIYNLEPNPIHDFVLCWGVLHHLPTPETGFQKISTQVAKGGILHIMVYHKDTQKIYEKGRAQWVSLSHEERIKLCQNMIKRHGGNLHGWWDAFNPTYNFSYTPEEVCTWFEKQGFTEITVTQEKNINIRGVKK